MSTLGRRALHSGSFPGAEHARCSLPEYQHVDFFPERPVGADRRQDAVYRGLVAKAIRVCSECVVRFPCLDAALEVPSQDDHGVLGGFTAKHRNQLRKDLKL